MTDITKTYLKNVKKELNCSFALKRYFVNDLKNKILDSNVNYDTLEELENSFGSPIEIRDGFKDLNLKYLKSKVIKMYILLTIIVIILLIVLICAREIINNLDGYTIIEG